MSNITETVIELLVENRLQTNEVIAKDSAFDAAMSRLDDISNTLAYEQQQIHDNALMEVLSITEEVRYRQGLQDGLNLINSLIGISRHMPVNMLKASKKVV